MIDTDAKLAVFLPLLQSASWLALDTEADSLHAYPEKVCLIQISTADGDRLVDPLAGLNLDPLLDANITFHGVLIGDDGQRTRDLAALLAAGELRAVVSHVLPLAEAARAHRILEAGHPGGKIILSVDGPEPGLPGG